MKKKNIQLSHIFKDEGLLKNYCEELRKCKPLKSKDQIDLIIQAKAGDDEAFNKIIKSNLRFVVLIAKDYVNRGIPIEDLIGEGNVGLIESVKRFDETKGFKFTTYAVWWIRQAMLKIIHQDESNVRLPINKINLLKKIEQTKDKLRQKLERDPSPKEIIDVMPELRDEDYEIVSMIKSQEFSFDQPVGSEESDISYQDIITSGEEFEGDKNLRLPEVRKKINIALDTLTDTEKNIVQLHCGLIEESGPMSFSEISDTLGLTSDKVRRIYKKAIENLRTKKEGVILASFS